MGAVYRIGADENGLGARLGPLVVTAVLSRVDEHGHRTLARRLPKRIAQDLGDSKELVSHADYRLGEAWARALVDESVANPAELFRALSHDSPGELTAPCPDHVTAQCWAPGDERFQAEAADVDRLRAHCRALGERGVALLRVTSRVVCTKRLNDGKARGHNRFTLDLHAMEQLVLTLRKSVDGDVQAICGKVGGMAQYGKFFGPLGDWLRVELEQSQRRSAYHFPGLGELSFVRDADSVDPLVMIASLVGKYVRELLMHRIVRFYAPSDETAPSGYHDPVTARFVKRTALLRRRRSVPDTCFERRRETDG